MRRDGAFDQAKKTVIDFPNANSPSVLGPNDCETSSPTARQDSPTGKPGEVVGADSAKQRRVCQHDSGTFEPRTWEHSWGD